MYTFMKIKFYIISMIVVAGLLSSCIRGNDDNQNIILSPKTSITAFSIHDIATSDTLKKDDGKDSVIITKLKGKDILFQIDQKKRLIYPVDSLPYGTDISRVLVDQITADTPFILIEKENEKGELADTTWIKTDSVDFRKPVKFTVMTYGMEKGFPYIVSMNVHKVVPDTMSWSRMDCDLDFKSLEAGHRSVISKGRLFTADGKNIASCSLDNPSQWTSLPLVADASSLTACGDKLFIIKDGQLFSSLAASDWEAVAALPELKSIIASTGRYISCITSDGRLGDYDTTSEEWIETASIPEGFPLENSIYVSYPLPTNHKLVNTVVMSHDKEGKTCRTFARIDTEKWYETTTSKYTCPAFHSQALIYYDGRLLSFGTEEGLLSPYMASVDGFTWKKVIKELCFPEELIGKTTEMSYAVDEEHHLWLVTNQGVWRGRINRLSFEK